MRYYRWNEAGEDKDLAILPHREICSDFGDFRATFAALSLLGKGDMSHGQEASMGRREKLYEDLGLLVVDEEQRFGVAHKEGIKNYKRRVDVLTLSATPIPRTLHMSMVGVRDLSLLESPPEERYPVQTYVVDYSDTLIRDAIVMTRPMAEERQIFIGHSCETGLLVRADEIRTRQVLLNLLSNALKSTFDGEIEVSVTTNEKAVILEVRDTGPGIDPAQVIGDRLGKGDRTVHAARATDGYGHIAAVTGIELGKPVLQIMTDVIKHRIGIGIL